MRGVDQNGDRMPARDRLLQLPEVFSGPELAMRFAWRSGIASTYLANWRANGLVKSLGGRSDVHMNLVANPNANVEAALRRAFPLSCLLGVDVLREAGWTTQIPSRPEVAVPSDGPVYAVEDFELVTRTQKWFQRVLPGVVFVDGGLDRLRPAWALSDMISRAQDKRVQGAWLLDPEDIDLEAAAADKHMAAALSAFGLETELLSMDGYGALYDELQGGMRQRDRIPRG